jgi:hypothetical protein
MPFKFESLGVWQAAIEYVDLIYLLAERLPTVIPLVVCPLLPAAVRHVYRSSHTPRCQAQNRYQAREMPVRESPDGE